MELLAAMTTSVNEIAQTVAILIGLGLLKKSSICSRYVYGSRLVYS